MTLFSVQWPRRPNSHRNSEVFFDRHAAEQPTALGHEGDSSGDALMRAHRRHVGAVEGDRAG